MSNQEVRALTKYSQSLGILAGLGVSGAQEQKAAYEEILKLIKTEPFEIIEPPLFSPLQDLSRSPDLKRLLTSAKEAFTNRPTKGELADALEEFIHAVSSEEIQLLPEAGILLSIAKQWHANLQQESEEALLVLEKRVSLNLDRLEEDLSCGESARIDLPVSIINRGIAAAVSIFLNVQITNDKNEEEIEADVDRAERIPPNEWRLKIDERIRRNERLDKTVTISYRGEKRVKIWLQYASFYRPRLELPSEALDFYLVSDILASKTDQNDALSGRVSARFGDDDSVSGEIENPYIPDQPLLKPAQWDKLVKGKHPQLLAQIMNDPELLNGRVLVIRGCRRSGKTTFLRKLQTETSAEHSLFLPVYVDAQFWFHEQRSTDKQSDVAITAEGLYYEFAAEIHENAVKLLRGQGLEPSEIGAKLKEARDSLTTNEGQEGQDEEKKQASMTLAPDVFNVFSTLIEQAVDRKILLIIDELDWWIQEADLGGNVASILNVLAAPSLINKPFSVLISHDLTSIGWDRKTNRTLLPRYVHFLKREDIESLAHEVSCCIGFSWCAVEFIWRVSGGWPGLAQLVFYVAIEVLRQKAEGRMVDVGIAKKAIDVILGTTEYKNFLSYLFGTLSVEEFGLLKTISSLADLDSGEFQYLRFNPALGYRIESPGTLGEADFNPATFSRLMDALKEKEIIEAAGDKSSKLRLRVGLLAYARTYNIDPTWH